jgi:hypothetical protein
MVKRRPPHCEEKGQPLLNKRKKKRQYNEPPYWNGVPLSPLPISTPLPLEHSFVETLPSSP